MPWINYFVLIVYNLLRKQFVRNNFRSFDRHDATIMNSLWVFFCLIIQRLKGFLNKKKVFILVTDKILKVKNILYCKKYQFFHIFKKNIVLIKWSFYHSYMWKIFRTYFNLIYSESINNFGGLKFKRIQ